MPNRIRGEAALAAGDRRYRLLLTLGALAEIEDGLGLDSLAGVAERLKAVRAADLAVVAAALLRGGGHDLSPADAAPALRSGRAGRRRHRRVRRRRP
jgi:hypothetical protein